jgi:ribonuclease HI
MITTLTSCFSSHSTTIAEYILVKWNNNNYSDVILNVDESCLRSPVRSGFGGVIKNDPGCYLLGFLGFIQGSSDIIATELFAIYQGLIMVRNMAINELICYFDSLHCINLIKCSNVKFYMLIQNIKKLLSQSNIIPCNTLRQ